MTMMNLPGVVANPGGNSLAETHLGADGQRPVLPGRVLAAAAGAWPDATDV